MALQLQVLQDKLPPFPRAEGRARRRARDGKAARRPSSPSSPNRSPQPRSRRVHKARLVEDGREVAVKILRPGIDRAFRKDIDAFYLIAWFVETLSPASRRLRPRDVIEHFEGA